VIVKCLEFLVTGLFVSLHCHFRSRERKYHRENFRSRVTNDILCSIDKGNVCALVLLDLSTAFDTVDHGLLLSITSCRFGLSGRVQQWPHSDSASTVYAEHSVVRCATRFGPAAGTIRHVYGRPWRVNHRLQCSTSLLCYSQLLASTAPSGIADVCRRLER